MRCCLFTEAQKKARDIGGTKHVAAINGIVAAYPRGTTRRCSHGHGSAQGWGFNGKVGLTDLPAAGVAPRSGWLSPGPLAAGRVLGVLGRDWRGQ